jgi:hypothetical protein
MKKKRFTFLAALLIAVSIFGQLPEKTSILEGNNQKMAPAPAAPEQISYQAVVRDDNNATVANQVVGMQISVLQTTANGTAVYVETQTPTTNANGLLSIYIGAGSAVTATFSVIDWSSGPYFIKIEIDPSGNNGNYTITGTTQLVSVPFALYAKTAGNDVLKENVANKSIDVATDAASDVKFPSVKSVKTYVDIVQADVDANEIASTSSDATLQGYINALEARLTALETEPVAIGDIREGGVVFWVDPADNTHGLVCALSDDATLVEWGCISTDLPNVPNVPYNGGNPRGLGAEIGDGESNTNSILNDCPSAPAAIAARSLGPEWFLPSAKELNQMYIHKTTLEAVSGFSAFSIYYWSSAETVYNAAWLQNFSNGVQYPGDKAAPIYVRAVRAF